MSLLQTFNRLTSAVFGDSVRTVPERQYFYPKSHYHPLWGTPGMTQEPRVLNVKANIPHQRRINPTNVAGDVPWQDHPILSDAGFWHKFAERKRNAWGDNYERTWRMRSIDFLPRTELRYRNIASGEHVGALQPNTIVPYRPMVKGGVDTSHFL